MGQPIKNVLSVQFDTLPNDDALKQVLGDKIEIITPSEEQWRGCQLSIKVVADGFEGKKLHEKMESEASRRQRGRRMRTRL